MGIDWDSAPEGFPVWINSLLSSVNSGWHKEIEGYYIGCAGQCWSKPEENYYIPHYRPESWNGKGDPPVGTVCEITSSGVFWEAVEIKFIGKTYAIVEKNGMEQHWHIKNIEFRTIRTPAQVAADNREIVINDMLSYCKPLCSRIELADAIYDAGYRKITEPM